MDCDGDSMRPGAGGVADAAPEWQDFAPRGLDFTDPGGDNGA